MRKPAATTTDAGMDDALGKPFSSDDLRRVMRPWLALSQSERQGVLAGLGVDSVDQRAPAGMKAGGHSH